jgi:type IV pilus assembly protein PilX
MSHMRSASHQRGMVLITSLLLLVVVTILAVGMFRSFGMDEKIAGNSREKQLSFNAAESAEAYAEWWIGTGAAGNGIVTTTCAAAPLAVPANATVVCNNAQASSAITTVPWTLGNNYTLPANGVLGTYTLFQQPQFYIYKFASGVGVGKSYYQIDALGYGGSPSATSIIEVVVICQQKVSSCGIMGCPAAPAAAC